MEYRQLGHSGLKVPVLAFGTATFGGGNDFFKKWGSTQVEEATLLVDIALEAGVNFFDTADVYSHGLAEEILGQAIGKRRDQVLLATKACFRMEPGANGLGASRHHLVRACEASLRRLQTDYIDLYQLHGFDALTPVEETLRALEDLIRSGKVRYIGASNFSGWHLMKSLAVAEKYGLPRHVSHQVYYSLAGGRLTGKVRRNQAPPADSRVSVMTETAQSGNEETLYRTVDVMDEIAAETGKTHTQIALNWLLQRPTVTSVIFGARNAEQLRVNLGAIGWQLRADQVARLDAASAIAPIYPYWHQRGFKERNPLPTG